MYGHKKAPWWIVPLETAEKWHTSPPRLVGGTKTLWYARQTTIREYEIQRANKDRKEQQRRMEEAQRKKR